MKHLVAAAALFAATPALATDITEPFTGQRSHTLDFHAGFTYLGYGLAAGLRYGIPIVHNGWIGSINNSVYINFGADFYVVSSVLGYGYGTGGGVGIGIPVALQWNFYFSDEWSAFGEVGINPYLDSYFFDGNGVYFGAYWLISAIGGRYHFSDNMALIGRAGNPYFSLGLELSL